MKSKHRRIPLTAFAFGALIVSGSGCSSCFDDKDDAHLESQGSGGTRVSEPFGVHAQPLGPKFVERFDAGAKPTPSTNPAAGNADGGSGE